MDPILLSVIFAGVGFAVRHFLPVPGPAPVAPSTFGHGELIKYLLQLLANSQGPVPGPVPVVPGPVNPALPVDFHQLLDQILVFLASRLPPVTPVPAPVTPK